MGAARSQISYSFFGKEDPLEIKVYSRDSTN